MARRHRHQAAESLELLLDTICNMFGGVVFIAILVALLTSAKTDEIRHTKTVHELQVNLRDESPYRIQRGISEYRQALEQLEKDRELLTATGAANQAALISSLDDAQSLADRRIAELQRWIQQYRQIQTDAHSEVEQKLETSQHDLKTLDGQLKAIQSAHVVEARLPIERRTTKMQVILLIQNGKIHWVPLGKASDLYAKDFENHVHVVTTLAGYEVRPNPTSGLVVGPNIEQSPQFRRLLGAVDSKRYFFDMYVAEDSIEVFRRFKQAIVQRGYSYNVRPFRSAKGLHLQAVDSVNTQ